MAEAYDYRNEDVTDVNGNVVDTARMRRNRGASWDTAVFRGTSANGRVRRNVRSAAGRGAARNPAFGRNNRA